MIQIFYLISAVYMVTIMSCQKESTEAENELNKVITAEKNGLGIEFCLLNENGEPDTVFQEGENFRFHLAIINNVEPDTSMYIVSDFLKNPDLFMVFRSPYDTVGRPMELKGLFARTDAGNEIKKGEKWVMEIPWHETRGTEEPYDMYNLIIYFQVLYIGLNQPPLSKGVYYTELTEIFCLRRYANSPDYENEPIVCTDTLELKINFEIK